MSGINYLDGSIYHMTHFDTSKGIFKRRAILCKVSVGQEKIPYRSIANDEVQDFRDRILIWDFVHRKYRSLHSYVPFYFAVQPPMLYNKYMEGVQDAIIIFEVGRSILTDPGVLFTSGNASNQQLSKFKGEKVGIKPATIKGACERRYYPSGPHGTGLNSSDFYCDIALLDRLDWDGINRLRRIDPVEEYVRIRHAEVLVPDIVPLGRVQGIYARTPEMVRAINTVIDEYGLTGRIPIAVAKPGMYF
jgi:hypothetical protein